MDEQLQMQHKEQKQGFLFLYALSQELKDRAKAEGFDVSEFIPRLGKFYQVRELKSNTIVDAFAVTNQFKYIIILAHHNNDDSLVLSDESHLQMNHLINLLPDDLQESVLDFAICKSDSMAVVIKEKTHCEHVLSTRGYTDLKPRFLTYVFLPGYMKAHPETDDYLEAYSSCLIELKQKVGKKNLRPSTTKLGDSSNKSDDSVKTSVFMPEEVTRGEFFKLQIKMHLDIDTGTLYFKEARGNDPNTFPRKENVAIKNIKIGDELLLNLCFLDGEDRDPIPTEQIKIKKELNKEELNSIDNIYSLGITISEENQTLVLHVKIANEYIDSKFFTIIEFVKDGKPLIEPFDLETWFKTEIPQPNIERPRGDIGGNQNKLVRDAERERVPSIEQMKQLEEERRERILNQLLDYVNLGNWKSDEIASEVKQMLLTILGKGKELKDKDLEMSEKLWKSLESVRIGKDNKVGRVGVVWQNIIGFLDYKGLFKPMNSPALNYDFFNTKKGYSNIDKGRPNRKHDNLSYWFKDIIELLDKYCPKIE